MSHVPGTIVICTSGLTRYPQFWQAVMALETPPGTQMQVISSGVIHKNREEAAATFAGEWLWFLDDDHTFEPDLLRRLLRHQAPVVAPLVLTRQAPFIPVMHNAPDQPHGLLRHRLLQPDDRGLIDVYATGAAGMLIRRSVFAQLDAPYFRPTHLSEDLAFCERCHAKGIPIRVDADSAMGHLATVQIWPTHQRGQWLPQVRCSPTYQFAIPQVVQLQEPHP